jgi:hypothetical protein
MLLWYTLLKCISSYQFYCWHWQWCNMPHTEQAGLAVTLETCIWEALRLNLGQKPAVQTEVLYRFFLVHPGIFQDITSIRSQPLFLKDLSDSFILPFYAPCSRYWNHKITHLKTHLVIVQLTAHSLWSTTNNMAHCNWLPVLWRFPSHFHKYKAPCKTALGVTAPAWVQF